MTRAPGLYVGLTVKQAELLSFIRYQQMHGKTPSFEEMRLAIGVASKSGIHRLVAALEERGYVQRLHGRARSIVAADAPAERPPSVLSEATIRQLLDELRRRGLAIQLADAA
jgi:repressor LexA